MIPPLTAENARDAQSFASLNRAQREKQIREAVETIQRLPSGNGAHRYQGVRNFAERLLTIGRFADYYNFTEERRSALLNIVNTGADFEIFFVLNDIEEGMEPILFFASYNRFKDFQYDYIEVFEHLFEDIGSEEFQQSIYQYLFKYSRRVWNKDSDSYEDPTDLQPLFIPQSAVMLKERYGEKRVKSFLDRMVSDSPVSAVEFVRLVQSGVDFKDYPMAWAVTLV